LRAHIARLEAARNKHHAAARRGHCQDLGRRYEVLDRVDRDRLPVLLDCDDAFHPKQPRAVIVGQRMQPAAERSHRLGLRPFEHEGFDRFVMRGAQGVGGEQALARGEPGCKPSGIGFAARRANEFSVRIDLRESRFELLDRLRLRAFGFREDQPIGKERLAELGAFGIERGSTEQRINDRHHRVEAIAPGQQRRFGKELQDRPGLGEAAGLDHDPRKRGNRAVGDPTLEPHKRFGQVSAHLAAHAAAGQQHHVFARGFDQRVVDADIAELVDHHRRIADRASFERGIEQRRLPCPQRAGQDEDRGNRGKSGVRVDFSSRSELSSGFHEKSTLTPLFKPGLFFIFTRVA